MTLSSTEAEWVTLLEAIKKVMSMIQLWQSKNILVKIPVMVKEDNVGAIFMASNIADMNNTKHLHQIQVCKHICRI